MERKRSTPRVFGSGVVVVVVGSEDVRISKLKLEKERGCGVEVWLEILQKHKEHSMGMRKGEVRLNEGWAWGGGGLGKGDGEKIVKTMCSVCGGRGSGCVS